MAIPLKSTDHLSVAAMTEADEPHGMMDEFPNANILVNRFGRADNVANLIAFLATKRASFLTGTASI